MAGYTDTEIEDAVAEFVKSEVTVDREVLGPVNQESRFTEVMQLISSTLTFDPNSIFYLVFLVTNELNKLVEDAVEDVDDLLDAISEMSKRTTEVTQTALLGNAAVALLDVDRTVVSEGAISTNSFERYKSSLNQFITKSLKPNIKDGTNIVRPPQKARSDSKTLLSSLSTDWSDILDRVEQIKDMLDEFNDLDLGITAIQDSVSLVRSDLDAWQDTFEDDSTTKDDKISETREAYLKLAAGKSVLENLTTISDPEDPRMVSTTTRKCRAAVPVGSLGELVEADVKTTKSGPWDIETGVNDEIKIEEDDSGSPTTYTLVPQDQPSVQSVLHDAETGAPWDLTEDTFAEIQGTQTVPITIAGGVNDDLRVLVNTDIYRGTLTAGTYNTGTQIVNEINAQLKKDGTGASISTVVTVSYVAGTGIKMEHQTSGSANSVAVIDALTNSAHIAVGFGNLQSDIGLDVNNRLQIDGLIPNVLLTTGSGRTAAQVVADIDSWISTNYPGVYDASVETVSGENYVKITKTKPGAQSIEMTNTGDSETVERTYRLLGFYTGQRDEADGVSASEAAETINAGGKVTATVERTNYESGDDGDVTSTTEMEVPAGSIDPSVSHTDDHLLISGGSNAGYHRIVSITTLGATITVTVDSDTPFSSIEGDQSWQIVRENLVITSKASDLTTRIQVDSASGNSTLGLTAGTDNRGTTTGFRVKDGNTDQSFSQADIVEDDIVRIGSPVTSTHSVLEVADDGEQLELDPPVDTDLADEAFQILSVAGEAYETFISALETWEEGLEASDYSEDIQELQRAMNPLLVNKRPSAAQVGDAQSAATDFKNLLAGLSTVLTSFEVAEVSRMDAALNMLQERGMDRSYDLLMEGEIETFFGGDKDDAANSSYMLKKMREVAQEDVVVSKLDEDADGYNYDQSDIEDTDPDYDYSDGDVDDDVDLIGEVVEDSDIDTTTTRY